MLNPPQPSQAFFADAIWTGIGATGSFLVGIAALGESANVWRIANAALIVLGVCGLRFTSFR
jgi:quaternary ammonium compound-resistance protein SugE